MHFVKLLILAASLGFSSVAAQTYTGLYTPYAPWDTRIQHNGTIMLLDASGGVIGTLTLRSLFDSPITALFPPVGTATVGTKVRVVFNAIGTTNGVANLNSSCTTDYTLTPPSTIPAGMSPKLVYTSRSLSPTLVITAEAPAIVDTTPPVVSITAPGAGATFVGTNAITASATDNIGVVGLQFQIDNANFSAEITAPPYTTIWNSTTVADGTHTISAKARDAAGNTATSTPVSVKVSNAPSPPPSGESPDGSTIPPLAQIIQVNAVGTFTWAKVGTHATVNGADSGGSGFDQILYKTKIIYAHQSGNGWWQWTGGGWSQFGGTP